MSTWSSKMKSVLWQRKSLSQYHNLAQLDEKWLKKGKNRESETKTCINKMCFNISLRSTWLLLN